jgi:hypothetical protein
LTRHTVSRNCTALVIAATAAALVATLWPADVFAQRRVVRRSGRTVVVGAGYYSPYYYWPRYYGYGGFYNGFYNPFFLGYYGQYRYPYPYYGWAYDNTGSARIQVSPRNTKVYVDGYFVGTVDDFDGAWQRLNVHAEGAARPWADAEDHTRDAAARRR